MLLRRELLMIAVAALLVVAALAALLAPAPTPNPTPAPSVTPTPSPSASASPSDNGGLPSADPFVVVRIEADLQASGPLTLCADGTMTVDLSLAATATGPVDLFLYRGAMIAVADPVAARDAAETAAGSVVRISPGSMEMVVVVAPPGTAALHAVLIGYRLEAAADDPDERIEIPAAAAPLAVGDAGC